MERSIHSRQHDREALARALSERYAALVPDHEELIQALLRPLPESLWSHPARLDRSALMELLRADGFAPEAMPWCEAGIRLPAGSRPGRHWGFLAGLFQVQEEVSMLPVTLLDPQPGERVLDLCAAPGNKTAQIAVAMANRGTVMGNDPKKGRLAALRQTVKRLGLLNTVITAQDGQSIGARAGSFDRVLVDAPCTCEGTFRKVTQPNDPDTTFRERQAATQVRLLERAVQLTRPGGRIVYATCTLAPEENEAVVDTVLQRLGSELRLVPARVPGFQGRAGVTRWQGRTFDQALTGAMRVWPQDNDTGGFFVAVLERDEGAPVARKRGGYFRPPEEPRDWLDPLTERFGIPASVFDGVIPVKRGNKHLHLVPSDHRFPEAPAPVLMGLPAVRRRSMPVKPTTAAALLYGCHAVRNVVDVDTPQAQAYLDRETIQAPSAGQLDRCTGPGFVVLRYRGYVLGLGQLIYDRETGVPRIVSLMPQAWSKDAATLIEES